MGGTGGVKDHANLKVQQYLWQILFVSARCTMAEEMDTDAQSPAPSVASNSKAGKAKFLCSAVSSPLDCSKCFTLPLPPPPPQ